MRTKYILFSLCIMLLTTACAPIGPTVRSNSNSSIELSQFKTFGFFEQLDTDYRYESLISQFLKEATITEMTNRGFVLTEDNPDLLINFHRNIEDKQDVIQSPALGHRGYYTDRGRVYYNDWIGYETYIYDYEEGTVSIDIVDRQQNKMVWEGVAIGRLTEENMKNLQNTLQKTVSEIFAQFPIIATP